MIRASGLRKSYPGFDLRVADLRVPEGSFITMLGPSGAGKSTLLRLLAGMEAAQDGVLERRGRAVYLDQDNIVLERNVIDNAVFGLRLMGVASAEARRRLRPWLARVGLAERLRQPAAKLSGGERARLALVRALATEPDVLLLDEPTQSLDPKNVAMVEALLREAHTRGRSVVLVTHNLHQARRLGEETWLLLDGRIVEQAPTETFFASPRSREAKAYLAGEMVY